MSLMRRPGVEHFIRFIDRGYRRGRIAPGCSFRASRDGRRFAELLAKFEVPGVKIAAGRCSAVWIGLFPSADGR
jgi:hypothetical protein